MRTADVHESERGSGWGVGEVLSVAVKAIDRGGGRCGFAIGTNSVATEWQQRWTSRIGVHRAALGFTRIRAIADRHRAAGWCERNLRPCVGPLEQKRTG